MRAAKATSRRCSSACWACVGWRSWSSRGWPASSARTAPAACDERPKRAWLPAERREVCRACLPDCTRLTYRGQPCLGISVELSRSATDTVRLLQGRRLSTRRRVARIRVEDALDGGFVLLPTFGAPHYTVVIDRAPTATIEALVALAVRDVIDNPYYQGRKEV